MHGRPMHSSSHVDLAHNFVQPPPRGNKCALRKDRRNRLLSSNTSFDNIPEKNPRKRRQKPNSGGKMDNGEGGYGLGRKIFGARPSHGGGGGGGVGGGGWRGGGGGGPYEFPDKGGFKDKEGPLRPKPIRGLVINCSSQMKPNIVLEEYPPRRGHLEKFSAEKMRKPSREGGDQIGLLEKGIGPDAIEPFCCGRELKRHLWKKRKKQRRRRNL